MSRIEQFSTSDEARSIIDNALASGECVVLNAVGALVGTKDDAISCFRHAASWRLMTFGEFEILACTDKRNVQMLAFDINTPRGCYLYGVSEHELQLSMCDMMGSAH
ncbi:MULTISPECIES: hypothetical protein [unclassified Bradyrhizobium]|uniref:hypothetical protein n=1 Tax=unclassified Bradyrhizobium TaxID=2631580 RepID=UPI002916254C|nr:MULTISPECIES: hypothetical protein [unclassified Bradyrhizobium]